MARGERVEERSEVTQMGWLLCMLGCIAYPGVDLCCLLLFRRKVRTVVGAACSPPTNEPLLSHE